jgi:hypothetical protein
MPALKWAWTIVPATTPMTAQHSPSALRSCADQVKQRFRSFNHSLMPFFGCVRRR